MRQLSKIANLLDTKRVLIRQLNKIAKVKIQVVDSHKSRGRGFGQ